MNNDVLTDILSYLSVPSLLRFRAVCKFWRDVIDSQYFRNLHTHNYKSDDTVYLQFRLPNTDIRLSNELSIELQHNGKSLMSYDSDHFNEFDLCYGYTEGQVRISQPVKGLICIYCNLKLDAPLAICNPFLGQLEILPLAIPSCEIGGISWREVAIGFDEDHGDYKVVQLYSCNAYSCIHAQMYRKRTNAWEQLADGVFNDLRIDRVSPIVSRCKNSHFAYWSAHYVDDYGVRIILSFDMKNEVFRIITLPEPDPNPVAFSQIFVEDENSFLNIVVSDVFGPIFGDTSTVMIYESRFEGSELIWNYVKYEEVTSFTRVPLLMASCVFIPDGLYGDFVFDYRARNIIARQSIEYVLVEYRGSLILP